MCYVTVLCKDVKATLQNCVIVSTNTKLYSSAKKIRGDSRLQLCKVLLERAERQCAETYADVEPTDIHSPKDGKTAAMVHVP